MSDKLERMDRLQQIVAECRACGLVETRKKVVFGEGHLDSQVLFVGEGPGQTEDETGRPFVGKSGKLLRDLIKAIGITDCYIANIVKCRPPGNRPPEQSEIDICIKFLKKQIEILSPKAIVLLGRTAVKAIFPDHTGTPIDVLRDKPLNSMKFEGISVVVTYHPSALLRDPGKKPKTLQDFLKIKNLISLLYQDPGHGPVNGDVPTEQLSIPQGVGVHGG